MECEASLAGLELTNELGIKNLIVKSDFQLIVNQFNGNLQKKEGRLKAYLKLAKI